MRQKRTTPAEADMTPMLDIVFILLIFFVVTASFLTERAMDMTPPPSGGSSITQPAITVSISSEGLVRVNGELSDIERVRARIEQALASDPEQAVIVQADKTTKNWLVLTAVDQARSAGVQSVGFMLTEG